MNLYDFICKLEILLDDEYKSYLRKILTSISNDKVIITSFDITETRSRFYSFNTEELIDRLENYRNSDVELFKDKYSKLKDEVNTRDLFNGPIINIIEFLEKVIEYKHDFINDNRIDLRDYVFTLIAMLDTLSVFHINTLDDSLINMSIKNDYFGFILPDSLKSVFDDLSSNSIDLDQELERIDSNLIDYETSTEVNLIKFTRNAVKGFLNYVLKIKIKIGNIKKNTKHFLDKLNIKRRRFYDQNMGKIDGLYKNYSGEAQIMENELNGDPTDILFNRADKYLANIIDEITKIKKNYETLIEKIFNLGSMEDVRNAVNNYVTYKDVKLNDDDNSKQIQKAIRLDLRYKVGLVLLKDNEIYGHNIESIVNKKYPPINHLMVSLFVPKPHEAPIKQSVSDVFKSKESFNLMSTKFKNIILETSKLVENRVNYNSLISNYKKYSSEGNRHIKEIKQKNKQGELKTEKTSKKAIRKDIKIIHSVVLDFIGLYESFVPLYIYAADAANAMYYIAMRIDKTCQDALTAMLQVEKKKTQGNYKGTGVSVGKGTTRKTSVQEVEKGSRDV